MSCGVGGGVGGGATDSGWVKPWWIMLQSSVLRFHHPTRRNTHVSDPHAPITSHAALRCAPYLGVDYACGMQR